MHVDRDYSLHMFNSATTNRKWSGKSEGLAYTESEDPVKQYWCVFDVLLAALHSGWMHYFIAMYQKLLDLCFIWLILSDLGNLRMYMIENSSENTIQVDDNCTSLCTFAMYL